jgi:uncharacterized protein (DUF2252 family)
LESELEQILEKAAELRALVVFTVVNTEERDLIGKLVEQHEGSVRFLEQPPVITRLPPGSALDRSFRTALERYPGSVAEDRRALLSRYRLADVAFKVVGVGSVGTRCAVAVYTSDAGQLLVLQVKEELKSCYGPYLKGVPRFRHQGRRVAEGQHRMQTASDPFLGWTSLEGRDYLVRQLCDHKAKIETVELHGAALVAYAVVAGEVLAKGHARTGSAPAIAGYCGATPRLDKALASFAAAYADQTTQDHERLVKAIRAKRIKAIRAPS